MSFHNGLKLVLASVAICFASHTIEPIGADETVGSTTLPRESVQKSLARAKETGRPLVVFGLSDTCSRCQAVKQGIATAPEFKLLMSQYVTTEITFAQREFVEVFQEVVRRDSKIPPTIGAPSIFIFTSNGDTVYAGPNRESGIAMDEEFKKLLISGIEKNGGLRPSNPGSSARSKSLSADISKARKLINENQIGAAVSLVSKHISTAPETDEQLAAVVALTKLQVAKSPTEQELEKIVAELSDRAQGSIETAVNSGGTDKAILGAVKLAELTRTFKNIPSLASRFEAAWTQLQEKSGEPQLAEQANLIDKARELERKKKLVEAIATYRLVTTTFPNTKAAELSQQRISQLEGAGSGEPRVWKSKNGKFAVTATLLSFDGKVARLKTADGKTLDVSSANLSAEDQDFLSKK